MAKPANSTVGNVGATTVLPHTAASVHRELPAVDVDPSTNPDAARLIASATTASVPPASATPQVAPEGTKNASISGGLIVDKLRISMTAEALATLDELERTFRRVTGDNISSGRVMRAGLRVLAELSQDQLIKAIQDEPEASAGRPAR